MKLHQIWNSRLVWPTLAALKKNPKLAYRLLKYQKLVLAEVEVCEQQRQKLVYEAAGIEPPAIVSLGEDTPEFKAFAQAFNEFALADSDLKWCGVTMDELIEALDAKEGNALSENDIHLLEPFFTAPEPVTAPTLRLVDNEAPQ